MSLRIFPNAGLTMIEIMIAIIVLTIGVVSILAIFPSSIKTASSSIEDTMAAKIAESVGDALSIAMRTSGAENFNDKKPGKVFLVHDGLPGGSYEFSLPLPVVPPPASAQSRFFAHPAANPADVSAPNPKPVDVFKLGGSDFIKQLLDDVRKGPDSSDAYDQYGFTFTIKRFDDARSASETGAGFIPNPLFQFAIAIYRLTPDYKTRYKDELPQPVRVFIIMIAGK